MRKKVVICITCCLQFFCAYAQHTLVKTSDDLYFRKGLELLDKEKYGAARESFKKYINLQPNDLLAIDAQYYSAYSALNLFNPDAEYLFQNFIAKYPYHTKAGMAYFDLGSFYYNEKNYTKAIEYLEKVDMAQLTASQKTEASFRLAYSYFAQKDFEKAAPLFNSLKTGQHKYTYASNYYAGFIEFRNGEYDAALQDLKAAENNDEYKPVVPFMIVNVLYKKNAMDELIAYSEDVLKNRKDVKNPDKIFLLTAEAYFRKGDYQKSSEYFNKYVKESNSRPAPEIQYRMAFSEYMTANYPAAIKDFQIIAIAKDSLGQSSAYYLGLSYLKSNNKEFALAALEQASKMNFNAASTEEALFTFAKVNFDLQRYNEALDALKEFVKAYPKSEHSNEASELLSEAFLRTNNYAEAVFYIESLKTRSPRINAAYQHLTFYKGIQDFNNQQFDPAVKMFEKSAQFPIDKNIYVAANFWEGESYSLLKNYDKAIVAYKEVLTNPFVSETEYYTKTEYGIGYAYYNKKEYEDALPHFKNYVAKLKESDKKENYDDAMLRLGDIYFVLKRYDEALSQYDYVINRKATDIDYAYYQKGMALLYDDKSAQAKDNFYTVIKSYPESVYYADALYQAAEINFKDGNLDVAIQEYTQIINDKPNSQYVPFALLKRAIANTDKKNYDTAIEDYNLLLNKYYNHAINSDALQGAQEAYSQAGRGEEFSVILEEFKKRNPNSTALESIEYESAKTLYYSEKYKQAVNSFNKYIQNYPVSANVPDAKYFLAESYLKTGDEKNAYDLYNQVVAGKSSSYITRAIQRLAEINRSNNKPEVSKDYYQLLLSSSRSKKDQFNAWLGLMESYYKLENYDSVSYYADQILNHGNASIDAQNKAYLYSGKAAYAKQDYEKATDFFLNTLNSAKDENGAEAEFLIAVIQNKQQNYKQSLQTLYDLNENFPNYESWLDKSFLLIADDFIALNEVYQAKATLNSIIENSPNKETVSMAKQKLESMEGKEEKK